MNKFSNILKYLRQRERMTQLELAQKLKISKSTISMYENGNREPDFETLESIADLFNVDMNFLMGKPSDTPPDIKTFDNLYPVEIHKYPMLGEIACGEPIYANEDRESYVLSGTKIDADFCLKARGDSMIGARILDGDIVFIKKTNIVDNGDIAAVIIDDEVLLKRFDYRRDENVLALHSENPRYKTLRFSGEELDHIHVLGKAVAFQGDVF